MYYLGNIKKVIIIFVIFTFNHILPIYAQDEHTVLLYTFEEFDGNTINDLSEKKNNGKIMGAKLGAGKFRRGIVFGGDEQEGFVEIPDNDSLDFVDGFTVEMWLYLNSPSSGGGTGVTKSSTYKVGPRNNLKLELRIATTSTAFGQGGLLSETDLPLRKWVHIAGSYDAISGDAKLYVDGELENEKNIGGEILPNDSVLWLGRGGNPFLHGSLDDVRISNIPRTQKEIQKLMEIGIDGVLAVYPNDKFTTKWGVLKNSIISN
ncbi:hypothetical protein C6497_08280 [Candidatus Poribacteria bacterium]|nr:MAG: hypothetical protein C6497_08280 [Candidatus Poribacteria bacterium]